MIDRFPIGPTGARTDNAHKLIAFRYLKLVHQRSDYISNSACPSDFPRGE